MGYALLSRSFLDVGKILSLKGLYKKHWFAVELTVSVFCTLEHFFRSHCHTTEIKTLFSYTKVAFSLVAFVCHVFSYRFTKIDTTGFVVKYDVTSVARVGYGY